MMQDQRARLSAAAQQGMRAHLLELGNELYLLGDTNQSDKYGPRFPTGPVRHARP